MSEAGRTIRRVALTGGIATGKSYCLEAFAALGAPTIDADALAKQAVAPGTAGFDAVRTRFGAAVIAADGGLDREALGRVVFADDHARRALEAIIHPAVYAAIQRWFSGLLQEGRRTAGIADIPLLFETGHDGDFDVVIVAACTPQQQLDRLMHRSGLSQADAEARIAAQWPIDRKRELASSLDGRGRIGYIIDTSGSHEDTQRQARTIWSEITKHQIAK